MIAIIAGSFAMGQNEAVSRINAALSEFGPYPSIPDHTEVNDYVAPRQSGRAALGTVKPAVLALTERPNGATVEEMAATGIKFNSIRGTIYALQKEGKIERRGERWFRISQQDEAPSGLEEAP